MEEEKKETLEQAGDFKEPDKVYFDTLEVTPDAPFYEIKSSYEHLKKLYSSESPVLMPVMEEVAEEKREVLLNRIEHAYMQLKEYFTSKDVEKQKTTHERVIHKNIPEFEVYSGNALKLTREVLGVELQEISLSSGIPIRHLQSVEMERFDRLPPEGYVKIYVTKYAEYLSLDTKRVTDDYMRAFHKQRAHKNANRY